MRTLNFMDRDSVPAVLRCPGTQSLARQPQPVPAGPSRDSVRSRPGQPGQCPEPEAVTSQKIRVVVRLGACVADRADCLGLLLLEVCRGRRPLGVVRRVVRRSESGCGAVGGEHSARVPRTLVRGLRATGFLRGAFLRADEPFDCTPSPRRLAPRLDRRRPTPAPHPHRQDAPPSAETTEGTAAAPRSPAALASHGSNLDF